MLVCWDTHRDTRNGRGLSFWNNISSYCYYTLYPRQPPRPPTLPPPPRCMMMIWKHDTNTQSLPHHDSEISCFSINKKEKTTTYIYLLYIYTNKKDNSFPPFSLIFPAGFIIFDIFCLFLFRSLFSFLRQCSIHQSLCWRLVDYQSFVSHYI